MRPGATALTRRSAARPPPSASPLARPAPPLVRRGRDEGGPARMASTVIASIEAMPITELPGGMRSARPCSRKNGARVDADDPLPVGEADLAEAARRRPRRSRARRRAGSRRGSPLPRARRRADRPSRASPAAGSQAARSASTDTTSKPSRARRSTHARPIPPEPPVTTATAMPHRSQALPAIHAPDAAGRCATTRSSSGPASPGCTSSTGCARSGSPCS